MNFSRISAHSTTALIFDRDFRTAEIPRATLRGGCKQAHTDQAERNECRARQQQRMLMVVVVAVVTGGDVVSNKATQHYSNTNGTKMVLY